MKFIYLFVATLLSVGANLKIPSIFRKWHCLGAMEHIDFTKPYKINVGELPLVVWKHPTNGALSTAINICNHMGSRLDIGTITDKGCLKCPYHGKELSTEEGFGQTMAFQGKLFWSYQPDQPSPPPVPFYENPKYKTSILTFDMDCSMLDSALNMMDIRHPEYVHKLGFGSSKTPTNIRTHTYPTLTDTIGLSFDYQSNVVMRTINDNTKATQNFHLFKYPLFTWSRVSFEHKQLIIAVNLLPLAPNKTRWYVTVCYDYYTTPLQKKFVEMMAFTILTQDSLQMKNQFPDSPLKQAMLLDYTFPDEEVQIWLRKAFEDYRYPTMDDCAALYLAAKMR